MGIEKSHNSIQQSTSTLSVCSMAEWNQGGKTHPGWWMAGSNRMEWPFPDDLFPTMLGNPLPGGRDSRHGIPGCRRRDGEGPMISFSQRGEWRRQGGKMARALEGAVVGRAFPNGANGNNKGGGEGRGNNGGGRGGGETSSTVYG